VITLSGVYCNEKRSYRDIEYDPLHVHFVDEEDKGLVPVGVQVARLHARLLLLADTLALIIEKRAQS
jgi:hypothetical protein